MTDDATPILGLTLIGRQDVELAGRWAVELGRRCGLKKRKSAGWAAAVIEGAQEALRGAREGHLQFKSVAQMLVAEIYDDGAYCGSDTRHHLYLAQDLVDDLSHEILPGGGRQLRLMVQLKRPPSVQAISSLLHKHPPAAIQQALDKRRAPEKKNDDRPFAMAWRRARRAIQLRDRILAVVFHDLRHPLGLIDATAATLTLGADIKNSQQSIRKAVAQMKRLVGDLMDFSSIESGNFALQREVVDLRSIVDQSLRVARPAAEEKSLLIHAAPCEAPLKVLADESRLVQALNNLLNNAIKFTPTGGEIVISLLLQPAGRPGVMIQVTDTGPGIPPDRMPHLFDPYWQGSSTDRRGVGLGLAIVDGIARAHQGRVSVESIVGEGTTFGLHLPPSLLTEDEERG